MDTEEQRQDAGEHEQGQNEEHEEQERGGAKRQAEQRQGREDFDDSSDWAWGREEIGREINRTPNQVSYLLAQGVLNGAVKRLGHRTVVASRRKLRALAARLIDQSP